MKVKKLFLILSLFAYLSGLPICAQEKPATTNIVAPKPLTEFPTSPAEMNIGDYVLRIHSFMRKVWSQTDAIWNGSNFKDVRFFLISPSTQQAWRLTPEAIEPVNFKQYEIAGEFSFKNKPGEELGVVLNLEKVHQHLQSRLTAPREDDLGFYGDLDLTIPFHEAFHAFVQHQGKWKASDNAKSASGDRSFLFPNPVEPRIIRAELYQAMSRAYASEDNEARRAHLSAAAFWNEEWKRRFSDEYASFKSYDIFEGTAQYFTLSGQFIWLGAEANPQGYRPFLLQHFQKFKGGHSPSNESYYLGSIAGFLLDAMGNKTWKQQVSTGESPIDILLKDVKPTAHTFSPEFTARISESIAKRNKEIETTVNPFLQNVNNPSFIHILIPLNILSGSFSPGEFVRTKEGLRLMSKFSGQFNLTNGNILKANGIAAAQTDKSVCEPNYYFEFVTEASSISVTDNQASIKTKGLEGEFSFTKTVKDNLTYYCVK